ncbi:MAG: antibiotic biosynthesis monooxygenase [Planctomycetaceae bacterium]|nr:antibiotic biosynthesis monooxygenase [Planctomycetaceae bacterium]
MIRIIARQVIKKECIAQYHHLVKELVEASRKEDGCLSYTSNQSLSDERVHCFIEDWKDQATIDAHNATEHFQRIVPQFKALFDGEERVELFKQIV